MTKSYTKFNLTEAKEFLESNDIVGRMYCDGFREEDFLFSCDGKVFFFLVEDQQASEMSDMDWSELEGETFHWVNGDEDWMETDFVEELRVAVRKSGTEKYEVLAW